MPHNGQSVAAKGSKAWPQGLCLSGQLGAHKTGTKHCPSSKGQPATSGSLKQ